MNILILAANPIDTDRLALDEEIRIIEREIATSRLRDNISIRSALALRPSDLVRELNEVRPDILHFSGHGSENGDIILVGNDGVAKPVDSFLLGELFSTLPKCPRVALLNACFSISNAHNISKYCEAVIGLPRTVADDNAVSFSSFFYSALSCGLSVHHSFRQAVIGVKLGQVSFWEDGEPSLLLKEGVSGSSLVLVGESQNIETVLVQNNVGRKFRDRDLGRAFLKREFVDFVKEFGEFSIFFIDIEGMGSINKTFGRRVGDVIISEVLLLIESKNIEAIALGLCGDDTFFVVYDHGERGKVIQDGTTTMSAIETHNWARFHDDLFVRVAGGYAVRKEGEHPADVASRAGWGLRTAQTAGKKYFESPNLVGRRFRGKPPEEKYKISEDEILSWFS